MFTNTYFPHVGGVARSVATFAEDLRNAGHRVLIVAPDFSGTHERRESEPDVIRVPAIQEFNGSDFSVRLPLPFLIEIISDFNPDIIHSHHPYLLGDTALRTARRNHLPLVFTHHTLYEEYAHYISRNSKNMRRLAAFLSTNYANLCDRVVAPSRSIKELIRQRGVTVPVSEIPTGVDLSFFATGNGQSFRSRHGIAEDKIVIGHLGRLAPEKNLDYLAAAAADALRQQPDCLFLLVGEGSRAADVRHAFAASGLKDRLIMPGNLSGQALADAFNAMNLFVFSSKTETQGMVLTEALASGVPVIALDAPGVREVVEDGENGRLLDADSPPEQFAQAVARAAGSPAEREPWAQNARKSITAFGRHRCAQKLISLYADAIGARMDDGNYKDGRLALWDKFLLACRAEWDLVTEKTASIMQTVDDNEKVIGLERRPPT